MRGEKCLEQWITWVDSLQFHYVFCLFFLCSSSILFVQRVMSRLYTQTRARSHAYKLTFLVGWILGWQKKESDNDNFVAEHTFHFAIFCSLASSFSLWMNFFTPLLRVLEPIISIGVRWLEELLSLFIYGYRTWVKVYQKSKQRCEGKSKCFAMLWYWFFVVAGCCCCPCWLLTLKVYAIW